MKKNIPADIDQYIAGFPEEIQKILRKLRSTIKKAAPFAAEAIKYGIPTFVLNGNLVHFAANKNHTGFYPAPSGIKKFKDSLFSYHTSKGAIQFPFDQPLPYSLISQIVKFRVIENTRIPEKKTKPKVCSNGHQYYKTIESPSCPVCARQQKSMKDFISALSAPAKKALEKKGIKTWQQLAQVNESEIKRLHGMGPASILKIQTALKKQGLVFKKK